ncbi:MAG: transposase domain-containing protein [Candidatus Sedimenticola sp. (ex Thyasira tokunagai)]
MTKEWFTASDLAGLPGVPGTSRGINKAAEREEWQWQRRAKGKGREYHLNSLPTKTQAACLVNDSQSPDTLSGTPALLSGPNQSTPGTSISEAAPASEVVSFSYDRDNLWAHYDRKSEKQKEAAKEKLMLLNAVMRLVDNGTGMVDSFKAVGLAHGKSWRTIQGWYHGTSGRPGIKHYERTDWLAALVPGYVGRTATAELSEEAWEFFKADYLRLEAPAATACYYRLERAAKEHGWTIPVLRTLERRLQHIPRTIRVLRREGEEGLRRLYPAQQRTVQDLHALQWINGDGYQHNVFVEWPNGGIDRPKTWFWQDVYSRKLLAYRVDLSENTDSIRLSFGDVVETFGISEEVTIDNTRAAANKWMTGRVKNRYRFKVKEDDPLGLIPTLCGRDAVHWTSVFKGKGHGQAKPIERAFGIGGIGEVVDKHPAFEGAYTGNNPNAKPENYGSKAIPIEKFLKILQEEVTAWNAKPGRRTEMCNGVMSFDQAFNASYVNAPIRKATAEQRRLWLLSAESIKVRNDGTVKLSAGSAVGKGHNRYHNHELLDHAGQKIVVRFDPEDLHGTVYAYTLDGRYLCDCECIEATGFGNTDAARSFNRERQRFVKATKLAAKAETRMTAMQVADQLPQVEQAETPNPKVVRPLRPEPKLGRPVPQPVISEAQAADIASFQTNFSKPAEVVSTGTDAPSRYERWSNLDRRLHEGNQLSDVDQKFWAQYQKGDEYRSMKAIYTDFDLKAEA